MRPTAETWSPRESYLRGEGKWEGKEKAKEKAKEKRQKQGEFG